MTKSIIPDTTDSNNVAAKYKYRGVAFCAKMCSGKSTLAKKLSQRLCNDEVRIYSHATFLKQLAVYAYGMDPVKKDRALLQKLGSKMREVNPDVFVNITVKQTNDVDFATNDDTRYYNEMKNLKDNGWLLVKVNVDEEVRRKRVKELYPNTTEEQMNDISETEMDTERCRALYDMELENTYLQDQEVLLETVSTFLQKE